jgi:copper chaperone
MCPETSSPDSREYVVDGMSCAHCVMSVTEEVQRVPGVASVDIDLESGRVVVRGDAFSDEAVRDAVDDAGYEVVRP